MEGFTFWRSYYETMKKADADTVKALLLAMGDYMFEGEEPDLDGVAALLFEAFRGNLDTSKARSAAGKKGGCASKQTEANASKPEANGSKAEALKTKTKNKDKKLNTKNKDKDEKQYTKHEDKDKDKDKDEELSCEGFPILSILSEENGLESYRPPDEAEWLRLKAEQIAKLKGGGSA